MSENPEPVKKRRRIDDLSTAIDKFSLKDADSSKPGCSKDFSANFQVLSLDSGPTNGPVGPKHVPNWIANAIPVPKSLDLTPFPEDLDRRLIKILHENGIESFFPIQAQLYPEIIRQSNWTVRPRDICVGAPTGSGKTLAYVLPILQLLFRNSLFHWPRAAILLPTPELARQVHQVVQTYSHGSNLQCALLIGVGPAATLESEMKSVVRPCPIRGARCMADILVATPGRLVVILKALKRQYGLGFRWLDRLRFLVLDEADRLMQEQVKFDWLSELEDSCNFAGDGSENGPTVLRGGKLPVWNRSGGTGDVFKATVPNLVNFRGFQKILLSATLSHEPEALHSLRLFQPMLFGQRLEKSSEMENPEMDRLAIPETLEEMFVSLAIKYKPLALFHLLKVNTWPKVLVFCNSKSNGERLHFLLSSLGYEHDTALCTSAAKTDARKKAVKDFVTGKIRVLIASDVLARGIDIPEDGACVVNYEPPDVLRTYVHRVGRVARAGHCGTAVTFLAQDGDEMEKFTKLLGSHFSKLKRMDFGPDLVAPYKQQYREALEELQEHFEGKRKRRRG